ncbi:MAG: putative lipid II flippase FtsW [Clostridia bacterium]|nr:putative lipid II flippase FtsW [Clostridia bacterium]
MGKMKISLRYLKERFLGQGRMDFLFFGAIMLLCVFGLVMVLSASYYTCYKNYGDGFHDFTRQAVCFVLGLVGMIVVSYVPYQLYRKPIVCGSIYAVTLGAMLIAAFFGTEVYGASRWIQIGGITVQPSELAKFVLVIVMAAYITKNAKKISRLKIVPLIIVSILFGLFALTILKQKNLSMIIILGAVFIIMLIWGQFKWWNIGMVLLLAIAAVTLALWMEPYRMERMLSFSNPWADPSDTGYQLIQSLFAIGSGGLFGKGLNFSRQKLLYLTFGENDFIFAIIAEELGFVGCLFLIALYAFVIYRGILIAIRCKEKFGTLVAGGFSIIVGLQAFVHMLITVGALPTTGQTLPFISAGGTSLVIFMVMMGVVLNISRQDERFKKVRTKVESKIVPLERK